MTLSSREFVQKLENLAIQQKKVFKNRTLAETITSWVTKRLHDNAYRKIIT